MADTKTIPTPIAANKELRDEIFTLSPIELGLQAQVRSAAKSFLATAERHLGQMQEQQA